MKIYTYLIVSMFCIFYNTASFSQEKGSNNNTKNNQEIIKGESYSHRDMEKKPLNIATVNNPSPSPRRGTRNDYYSVEKAEDNKNTRPSRGTR